MAQHRHQWVWLVPKSSEIQIEDKTGYVLECMLGRLMDITICKVCRKTGHVIKSRWQGIRVHHEPTHYYDKAKAIADKYKFTLKVDEHEQKSGNDSTHG